MDTLLEKFAKLGCDNAPGQEGRQKAAVLELRGEKLSGTPVDFSHGDVDAHPPIPGTLADFVAGVEKIGGHQAYTEYRGGKSTREDLARKISAFTGAAIDPEENIILTPGTQGALFLAIGANMVPGDKVAIVEPDYFANRKLVEFFGGEKPASEIETQFVIDIINEYKLEIILTLHAPFKVVNYDGPAEQLAEKISKIINYPVEPNIGYPTPGSFGTYAGVERQIKTITLELDEECPQDDLVKPVFEIFDCLL